MRSVNTASLLSIFPPALKKSPDYCTLAQAIAPELYRAFLLTRQAEVLCRVDELPEDVLDALAYDLDVFWWRPDATLAEKRVGIKQALMSHRRLGTTQAVQDAINAYFGGGSVEEWFEYNDDPFYFRIYGANVAPGTSAYAAFLRTVDGVKRCSAVMSTITGVDYLTDENGNQLLYTDDSPLVI